MSAIICPSNFSAKNISVAAPRQLSSGAKQSYISYGGEKLVMQTALSMTVPFGLNVADKFGPPEYSVDLSFRGFEQRPELKEFMDVMQQLDEALISEGVKNSRAWFKADLGRDVVKAFYTPSLKYSKDKEGNVLSYPPTIKLKLRKYNGEFETKFYDLNGSPYRDVPLEELLVKGVQVTGIMECAGVWFAGSKFGLTWRAKQIAIHKLPEKMSDFAFKGLSLAPASSAPSPSASSASSSSSSSNSYRSLATEEDNSLVDDDEAFAPRSSAPSVIAAVLPQLARPVPVATPIAPIASHNEENNSEASSVNDNGGDDVEPVPAPRRTTVIKKKVIAK